MKEELVPKSNVENPLASSLSEDTSMAGLDLTAPLLEQVKFLSAQPKKRPWSQEKSYDFLAKISKIKDILVEEAQHTESGRVWSQKPGSTGDGALWDAMMKKSRKELGRVNTSESSRMNIQFLETQLWAQRSALYRIGELLFNEKEAGALQKSRAVKIFKEELLSNYFLERKSADIKKDYISLVGCWINSYIWFKSCSEMPEEENLVREKNGLEAEGDWGWKWASPKQKSAFLAGRGMLKNPIKTNCLASEKEWSSEKWVAYCELVRPHLSQIWSRGASDIRGVSEVLGSAYPYVEAQSPIGGAGVSGQSMLGALSLAKTLPGASWLQKDNALSSWLLERVPLTKESLKSAIDGSVDTSWLRSKVLSEEELCMCLAKNWERERAPRVIEVVKSIQEEHELNLALSLKSQVKDSLSPIRVRVKSI